MTALRLGLVAAVALAGAAIPFARAGRDRGRSPDRASRVALVVSEPSESASGSRRVPAGSRILAVPLGGGEPRTLCGGLAAAGAPSVSFDGTSLLLAGRAVEGDPDAIFEARADGGGVRKVFGSPLGDCGAPAWLPDGRVLFTAPAAGFRGLASGTVRALFSARADGSDPRRLTFHADGEDADPVVLADGRILYVRRDRGGTVLLAVHNDGTGVHAFHGPGLPPADRARPREDGDRGLWYVAGGEAWRVDARRPERAAAPAELGAGGEVRAVEPLPGGDLLLSARPAAGGGTFGIRLLSPGGPPSGVIVLDDPGRDETSAVLLAPRAPPRGHLSAIAAGTDRGRLYCVDARRTAGRRLDRAAAVRIFEALPGDEPGLLDDRRERLLGELALPADGSIYAEVPADRPLRVEVVDAAGLALAGSAFSLWIRPGEIRACIGCHEDPAVAPPNVLPEAVRGDPADLARPDRRWRAR